MWHLFQSCLAFILKPRLDELTDRIREAEAVEGVELVGAQFVEVSVKWAYGR
ncbi:MAG: hypothetical protein N3F08_02680 [Crenarchaeota archaeon]|nr:hypothetical protein [Thermoproteota archaeon]